MLPWEAPELVLTSVRSVADRNQREQQISKIVFDTWNTPYTQNLRSRDPRPALTIQPRFTPRQQSLHALALVLTPVGIDTGERLCYQWQAYIQLARDGQYEVIPNAAIVAPQSVAKDSLDKLLQGLKRWIAANTKDICMLEIFVPVDLLDEDWGSISVGIGKAEPLHSYQPYLLRSSDRLLDPEMNERTGALRRMHHHLVAGSGAWLPQDQLTQAHILETLDGEDLDQEAREEVVAAICCFESSAIPNRSTWLHSVLKSMAPLVVWPSPKGLLPGELTKEEVASFLGELSLNREDSQQGAKVNRPHCPDLDRLAKRRQAKAKLDWPHPRIDLGLTILVDHPDRSPDPQTLEHFFQGSRNEFSRAPVGKSPNPPAQLLISS